MPSGDGRPNDEFPSTQPPTRPPVTYDPTKYYLESTDSKGHSEMVRFRVLPWVTARIAEVVSRPDNPYRTPADFHRDALVHYCNYVVDNMAVPDSFREAVRAFTIQATIETANEEQKARKNILARCRDLAFDARTEDEKVLAHGSLNEVIRQLSPSLLRTQIESLRDNLS